MMVQHEVLLVFHVYMLFFSFVHLELLVISFVGKLHFNVYVVGYGVAHFNIFFLL